MNIGMMNPDFDGAIETMAKISNLAHAQAMAPYQFQQAALANQRAQQANELASKMSPLQLQQAALANQSAQQANQLASQMSPLQLQQAKLANQHAGLVNKYLPQQMDVSLANTLAKLSGQQLSSQRFLSNASKLKQIAQGIGKAQMNKLLSQGVPATQAARIVTASLAKMQPNQQDNQVQPQERSPYQQEAYNLLSKYPPPATIPTTPAAMAEPSPAAIQPDVPQNVVSDAAKAIQQASESAAIKSTTDVGTRSKVAAGDRLNKAISAMKPFLSDYAHYAGLKGMAAGQMDKITSMFKGKMPQSLSNAKKFESLIPSFEGEIANMLGVPKTGAGMEEIKKTLAMHLYDTPDSYMQRFNNYMEFLGKTHAVNKGTIAQLYGKKGDDKNKASEKSAIDILSEFRGK